MTDFLGRLAARALDRTERVQPRRHGRFERLAPSRLSASAIPLLAGDGRADASDGEAPLAASPELPTTETTPASPAPEIRASAEAPFTRTLSIETSLVTRALPVEGRRVADERRPDPRSPRTASPTASAQDTATARPRETRDPADRSLETPITERSSKRVDPRRSAMERSSRQTESVVTARADAEAPSRQPIGRRSVRVGVESEPPSQNRTIPRARTAPSSRTEVVDPAPSRRVEVEGSRPSAREEVSTRRDAASHREVVSTRRSATDHEPVSREPSTGRPSEGSLTVPVATPVSIASTLHEPSTSQASAPETVVTVKIGRIDVRAVTPPSPPVHEPRRGPSLRLDTYLKARSERRR